MGRWHCARVATLPFAATSSFAASLTCPALLRPRARCPRPLGRASCRVRVALSVAAARNPARQIAFDHGGTRVVLTTKQIASLRDAVEAESLLRGEEGQRWIRLCAVCAEAGYTPLFEFVSPQLSPARRSWCAHACCRCTLPCVPALLLWTCQVVACATPLAPEGASGFPHCLLLRLCAAMCRAVC